MAKRTARVQCSTGPFWAWELERAMDVLAEGGFAEIELMVTRDPRTQAPEIPARLAEERGLKIASVHGPFLAISKTVWGLDPIQKIRRGTEFCRSVGADTMIVHPPYLWERAYAGWIEAELESYCADEGIVVAVETMYPKWLAGRRLRGYRWVDPHELAGRSPYIALDTSHVTVARHDLLDSYRVVADKLVHVHLSDNAGDGRDGHLEIEQGVLPLDRFLDELRRDGYRGVVSLELSVRRYLQRPEELVGALKRNRLYVENRLRHSARVEKGMPRR